MKNLLALVILSLCISNTALGDDTKEKATAPIIITLCQAMQGNGFNWAATISWISETFKIRAIEGRKLQKKTDRDVLFYLDCAGGGSSGAATTALYAAMLTNPNFANKPSKLYTPEEVTTMSRALKYVAYATDLTGVEFQKFMTINNKYPGDGTWWAGHYDAEMLLGTFGRRILLMNKLSSNDIDRALLPDRLAAKMHFDNIEDIPVDGKDPSIYTFSRGFYNKLIGQEANKAKDYGRAIIGGLDSHSDLDRADIDVHDFLENTDIPNGLMSGVYGLVVDAPLGISEVKKKYIEPGPVPFKRLRPVYFMNERTLKTIVSSSEYQKAVLDPNDTITKSILLVGTKSIKDVMSPSTREPYATKIEYKLITQFGSGRYFDPMVAIENKEKHKLRNVPFSCSVGSGMKFSRYLINVGGWGNYKTTQRLLGFYMMALHQTTTPNRENAISFKTDYSDASHIGFLNSFGKYGTTTKFNLKVINKLFTKNDDLSDPGFVSEDSPLKELQGLELKNGVLENLALYYHHSFDFERNFKHRVESFPGANIETTHVGLNWDKAEWKSFFGLALLPGAFCKKGRDLTMLTVNFTRAKLNINMEEEVNYLTCITGNRADCHINKTRKNSYNSLGWEFDAFHDRNYYHVEPWPEWLTETMQDMKLL
jgi:hypothetical protein